MRTQKGSNFEKAMIKYVGEDKNIKKNEGASITYKLHFENGIANKINDNKAHHQFEPLFGNSHYIGLVIFISFGEIMGC